MWKATESGTKDHSSANITVTRLDKRGTVIIRVGESRSLTCGQIIGPECAVNLACFLLKQVLKSKDKTLNSLKVTIDESDK